MNKYALITGASIGIGKSLCEEYASHGYNIIAVARNKEALENIKKELETKYNIDVRIQAEDLTDDKATDRIHDYCVKEKLDVEVLINNAGMGASGDYASSDWNRQKAIIDLDVIALMHMCRAFLPDMLERGHGKIGNIASNAAFMPLAPQPSYGAAKAAVLSFSQALYEQYKNTGVSVSVICPGPVKTDFFKNAGFDLKNLEGVSPEEVAKFTYNVVDRGLAMRSHTFLVKVTSVLTRLLPRKVSRELASKIAASK